MKCRHCGTPARLPFVDLGIAPPSNAYLSAKAMKAPEKFFPLRVLVCERCWLVQTEDFAQATELFDADYAYFSSYSTTWIKHAERYVEDMVKRFNLDSNSRVIEVAANDGYLLQFVQARGIPNLGIEPTASTAAAARTKGLTIIEEFFGVALAQRLSTEGKQADLMTANNVLAHVPDVNDFVRGFARVLRDDGVATFEFPHLLRLVSNVQFDTIYHEHFSYLSLTTVTQIFSDNGLRVFDVQEHPTHGGSLRVFAQRAESGSHPISAMVQRMLDCEHRAGMTTASFYAGFQDKTDRVKNDFLKFLIDAKNHNKPVAAYGAAAKGNTLMNYAGVRRDLIPFVVDANPSKQGKFMPGSRIPIVSEERLRAEKPAFVVVFPWNLIDELKSQLAYISDWGGKLVTAIPSLHVHE